MKQFLLVLFACFLLFGCVAENNSNGLSEKNSAAVDSNAAPQPSISDNSEYVIGKPQNYAEVKASEEDLKKSGEAISTASNALSSGDKTAFISALGGDSAKEFELEGNFSVENAKKLGDAMQNAKLVENHGTLLVYEYEVDGRKGSFVMVKVGDVWKVEGL